MEGYVAEALIYCISQEHRYRPPLGAVRVTVIARNKVTVNWTLRPIKQCKRASLKMNVSVPYEKTTLWREKEKKRKIRLDRYRKTAWFILLSLFEIIRVHIDYTFFQILSVESEIHRTSQTFHILLLVLI